MSIQRVLYRTMYRIGRGPSYFGGRYGDAKTIGKYKVEAYEDDTAKHILLWNPIKPCIVMYIEKQTNIGVMSMLEYDAKCTVDGEGTREMVKFAIEMLREAGATKIELQDESTIVCDELGGVKIKLGPFSFLRQGKTWYEKYFGFVPAPQFREEYEHAKTLRKTLDISMLQQEPCSYFDRATINKLLRTVELDFYNIVWELYL